MKKLSLILAGALLMGGISFASPVVKQQQEPAKAKAAKSNKGKSDSAKGQKKGAKKGAAKKADKASKTETK